MGIEDRLAGKPAACWIDTTPTTDYPALQGGAFADVAVIGGGIVGLTAADLLKRDGKTAVVIESRRIAEQVTGHTTAKVTSLHGLIYAHLIKSLGEETARLYGQSNQAAIERIASLVTEKGIDCDFERKAAYTYSRTRFRLDEVEAEVEAAVKLGLPARLERETTLPYAIAGAVCFDNQAQFHPRKYLLALAQDIPGGGSAIYENTRALDVEEGNPCRVITDRGTVTARDVIVATNLPITNRGAFFAKAFPRRHMVLAAEIDDAKAPDGMFLSVEVPSHSIRTWRHDGKTYLIVVGGSFKPGQAETIREVEDLQAFVTANFDVTAVWRWGNQDYTSMDRMPYIGRITPSSRHVYVATGFNAWGMTGGTVAAMILADAILERPNPWARIYDATRLNPGSSAESFLKENAQVAKEWVGKRITTRRSIGELTRGEGAVVRINGENLAAYKHDDGSVTAVSPTCTHMGCIVGFNAAEKSWDCPCHGSRFALDGRVINGPAVRDLEKKVL